MRSKPGRPALYTASTVVSVLVSDDVLAKIQRHAVRTNQTLSSVLREIISKGVSEMKLGLVKT